MLKHAFGTLIPICVISTVLFGVSVLILGTGSAKAETHEDDWELDGSYSEIQLDLSSYNVKVKPTDGDVTTFYYSGSNSEDIHTIISGEKLKVSTNTAWFRWSFPFSDIIEGIKTGSWDNVFEGDTLEIGIPQAQYDLIEVNLGSGSVKLSGLDVKKWECNIGSGNFEYRDNTAKSIRLDMGSGKVTMTDAASEEFVLNVGSGNFDIRGLTAPIDFDMGSGNGTIDFAQVNGSGVFELGSGNLTVVIPEDTNAKLTADKGSGNITIKACGVNQQLNDNGSVTLGSGENKLHFELGSGNVKVVNTDDTDDTAVVTTAVSENRHRC